MGGAGSLHRGGGLSERPPPSPAALFQEGLAALVLRVVQLFALPVVLGLWGWMWQENAGLHKQINEHHGQLIMLRNDLDRADRERRSVDDALRGHILEMQTRSEQARAELAKRGEDRANGQERRMGELGGELGQLRDAVIRASERLDGVREQMAARSGEAPPPPPRAIPRALDGLPRGWRQ